MADLHFKFIDNSEMYLDTDQGILMELVDEFSFLVEGYRFNPMYKSGRWDGKIRLIKRATGTCGIGLMADIVDFCQIHEYTFAVDNEFKNFNDVSFDEIGEYTAGLALPFTPRDYQAGAIHKAIKRKRLCIESPTGSGKSLIIYSIIRWLQDQGLNILLVVPNVSLLSQMSTDFDSYAVDSEWSAIDNCHLISAGVEKTTDKQVTISTWQSLQKDKKDFFDFYDAVIVDEAHSCVAKSLQYIVSKCDCEYKMALSGTISGGKFVNELTLKSMFGAIHKTTSTRQMMDAGTLSTLKVKGLLLSHTDKLKKVNYQDEIAYLVTCDKRNQFISKLAAKLSYAGTTLVLFSRIEHGKLLADMINDYTDNPVFYIAGEIKAEDREEIRVALNNNPNAILVGSVQCVATGLNIPRLQNLVLTHPSKSQIRVLQSIGRILRNHEDKSSAVVFDIADDLSPGRKDKNYSLKHFLERVQIYNKERFAFQLIEKDL